MKNNFFLNKKILVTGGSGSIGSGIVKTLMKKKCKVIIKINRNNKTI